ncbi:uncharacterized protein P884DRAFT_263445 [Thermothelomyces heterothallicus CBS 202.75]|uniref:uncharacterized protein n=1 Tax=Thermothelomyces heterothallicus CBS 202.75 TaxID=1149848 RepID=UPI00374254EB
MNSSSCCGSYELYPPKSSIRVNGQRLATRPSRPTDVRPSSIGTQRGEQRAMKAICYHHEHSKGEQPHPVVRLLAKCPARSSHLLHTFTSHLDRTGCGKYPRGRLITARA